MKITHKINQVTLVVGFGIFIGSFTRVGRSLVSKNKDEEINRRIAWQVQIRQNKSCCFKRKKMVKFAKRT
jgi:hypothetical protein